MKKNRDKQFFWFLNNKELRNYFIFKIIEIFLLVLNFHLNIGFLETQKLVQSGKVFQNWKAFIFIGFSFAITTAIITIFEKYYGLKMNTYLRFNIFRRYRKQFQTHEKAVFLKSELVTYSFGCVDKIIAIGFNIALVVKTTQMVEFSQATIILAIVLLVITILLGIWRGIKRAKISEIDSAIRQKEGDLTKFYTFSRNFLENALYVLKLEHNAKIRMNVFTGILTQLPTITKELIVVISIYGLVNTLAEGVVYSNSYIIMTAFGVVLSIASGLGDIFENIFGCIKICKNPLVKELNAFEAKEKIVISEAQKCISASTKLVTISNKLTADLLTSTGVKHYYLRKQLHVNIGSNILLVGQKGTGKTRFLQLLENINEEKVMIYNDRTTVFSKFYDNFKSPFGWNYSLIQELAKGLKLHRFLLPETQLKKLDLRSINTGDIHLLAALIMLYYAIIDPNRARVIIMDELLANVDKQNAEEILNFVVSKGKDINATIIFVGHSQQEMIQKHCKTRWTMTTDEAVVYIDEEETF